MKLKIDLCKSDYTGEYIVYINDYRVLGGHPITTSKIIQTKIVDTDDLPTYKEEELL